ncbi:MAG: hypothetical protein MUP24_07535, partial [Gillisia sp.]|nr:hypothetical protein [Gillisia sp.]
MKSKIKVIVSSMLILFLTIGMTTSTYGQEDSKEPKTSKKIKKQRKKFTENKEMALNAMYKAYPGSKAQMSNSYAYAAFGNT